MHGVAGPATAQFLEDNMTEPSLSRTHKLVETTVIATEEVLNDRLLRSARLLCYRVGELVAYSRLGGAGFRPKTVGLDLRLCRALMSEAEKLLISAEAAMSELKRARLALSKLFKWFKALHATVHAEKSNVPTSTDDVLKYKLKAHDQQDMATLLTATRFEEETWSPSKTETVLDLGVTNLLSDPVSRAVDVQVDYGDPLPEHPTPNDIAIRIKAILESEKRAAKKMPDTLQRSLPRLDSDTSDCEDECCHNTSVFIHARLTSVDAPE